MATPHLSLIRPASTLPHFQCSPDTYTCFGAESWGLTRRSQAPRTLLVLCSGCEASSDSSAMASGGASVADTCHVSRVLVSVGRDKTYLANVTAAPITAVSPMKLLGNFMCHLVLSCSPRTTCCNIKGYSASETAASDSTEPSQGSPTPAASCTSWDTIGRRK